MTRNIGKLLRDLQRRKARQRRGYVVAEGRRLVEEALAAGADITAVVAAEDAAAAAAAAVLAEAQRLAVETHVLPRAEFDALAETETPSGVLAVVAWAPRGLAELEQPPEEAVLLVLDGVQDPGNAGTMLRTAHALGAWATVALDGTADLRSPKVVRGAMGAHFRHPIVEAAFADAAAWLGEHRVAVHVAAADGEPVRAGAARGRVALVVGSEAHGARAGWAASRPHRVAIPMRPEAESLNAAVAAGILLFAYARRVR